MENRSDPCRGLRLFPAGGRRQGVEGIAHVSRRADHTPSHRHPILVRHVRAPHLRQGAMLAGRAPLPTPRATLPDIHLVAPQFHLYRQFYQQPPNPELARGFITERLERNESVIFLALDDESNPPRAAGFVQLYHLFSSTQARPMWLLNDLYVSALYRRNGVGRR